jgi:membrane-bound serine protease (ClpP class)
MKFKPIFLLILTALGLFGFARSAPNTIPGVIIKIEGEIDPSIAGFLERQLEDAAKQNRPLIVLDIDTPGGRVDSAIKMSDDILNSSIPTVAVVTNAFSAGALIAMSAEQVVMLPGSEIGAALPISSDGTAIPGQVGEKINSALRTKFRSVATTRGRNADAAEGMVNPNKVIPGLKDKGEILTLTASDAVKNKIANFEARNIDEAVRVAGFSSIKLETVLLSPAEQVGAFLSQPIVAGILLAIGVIGILIELLHPGVALPGIVGGISLLAYFAGSWLSGNGSSVALLLLLAGLGLIVAEILFVPGSTIVGLLGVVSILASVYLQYGDKFWQVASVSSIVGGLGLGLILWMLPQSQFMKRLYVQSPLAGSSANWNANEAPKLEGRFGTALTDLRPSGVADIEGERVDVVSNGEFITLGTKLEVVKVEGRRVLVKALNG